MFSAIRRRMHLSPATVIAGLALVFAMTGGAYAAKKYLITSTKQISPSVLKQLQGKAGAAGAPGAAGAQGAQGPAGPAGPGGAAGAKGETGSAGVKGEAGSAGAKGEKGVTGATGATGATGVSGFTEKLPKDKTETGVWGGSGFNLPEFSQVHMAISFAIPLAAPGVAVYLNKEATDQSAGTEGCTGNVAEPTAPSGKLCIYTAEELIEGGKEITAIISFNGTPGTYQSSGTVLRVITPEGAESLNANGSWAVTAP